MNQKRTPKKKILVLINQLSNELAIKGILCKNCALKGLKTIQTKSAFYPRKLKSNILALPVG